MLRLKQLASFGTPALQATQWSHRRPVLSTTLLTMEIASSRPDAPLREKSCSSRSLSGRQILVGVRSGGTPPGLSAATWSHDSRTRIVRRSNLAVPCCALLCPAVPCSASARAIATRRLPWHVRNMGHIAPTVPAVRRRGWVSSRQSAEPKQAWAWHTRWAREQPTWPRLVQQPLKSTAEGTISTALLPEPAPPAPFGPTPAWRLANYFPPARGTSTSPSVIIIIN